MTTDSELLELAAKALRIENEQIKAENEPSRCVIRLSTSSWADKRSIQTKRSLTYLRRECKGFNVLAAEASDMGASPTICKITNLGESEDGIYEVVVCNESRDWESGLVDDWNYQLIPFTRSDK